MTAPVDICNRALAEIGTRSTISSLTEASPEAINCSLVYDPMRKKLLRAAHWGFARFQEVLNLLGNAAAQTSPFPYLYRYAYPADCIRLRYLISIPDGWPFQGNATFPQTGDPVVAPLFAPCRGNRFLVYNFKDEVSGNRQRNIISNLQNAIAVYTADIDDPSDWDDMFEDALVAAVASKIVIPLTGNAGMKMAFAQVAQAKIDEARAADGNEAHPTTDHVPDWIRARGFDNDWYFAQVNSWGNWYGGWDDLNWGM